EPLPCHATVNRFPEIVVAKEECSFVHRRERHRKCAHGSVGGGAGRGSRSATSPGNGGDVLVLRSASIVAGDLAAVNNVRVTWVGNGVTVFLDSNRMPLAKRDLPIISAARHTRRAAFLLTAADAERKIVVGVHVIELRGRLVVPGTPG